MSSNPESLIGLSPADEDYARVWADSISSVLESLYGQPFAATPHAPTAAEIAFMAGGENLWVPFRLTGALTGEQVFQFAKSDGVRMAQLLMSEPMDGAIALSESHVDALSEIFRQFAGLAGTACKSRYGGEVQFELLPPAAPEWNPAARSLWIFAAPDVTPLQVSLLVNAETHGVLETRRKEIAVPVTQKGGEQPSSGQTMKTSIADLSSAGPNSVSSAAAPANLELLLDVELEASLRFGQREMLLREILELRPGSVVELDRRIQEPAELLVAGRVIARGEVVIVDGNYGVRITDVAQPRQRLESVEV